MHDEEENELSRIRKEIDRIDYQIHDLINERAKLALQISAIKIKFHGPSVTFYRPERERVILDRVKAYNRGPLDENAITRIFENIVAECRQLQITTYKKQET